MRIGKLCMDLRHEHWRMPEQKERLNRKNDIQKEKLKENNDH